MDIRTMQYRFGIQLNQFDDALTLNSDDIEYWLNKAQIEIVKREFSGINEESRSFEQSQRVTDDLRILLTRDKELPVYFEDKLSGIDGFYADRADFPSDYMFLISHKSCIQYKYPSIRYTVVNNARQSTEGTSKVVFNRYAQHASIYKMLSDPFNKTKPSSPLAVINQSSINIFTDKTFIVTKVIIDYLRLPTEMDIKGGVDCELPEHMHEEIIQRAVDLFLNNTRQLKQRLQRETPVADRTTKQQEDE